MNDKIKTLFSNLGSSYAKQLGFRDSWVFVGAKDLKSKSPYEQVGSWLPPRLSEGEVDPAGASGDGKTVTHVGCIVGQRLSTEPACNTAQLLKIHLSFGWSN
jgi:hypothetical protein